MCRVFSMSQGKVVVAAPLALRTNSDRAVFSLLWGNVVTAAPLLCCMVGLGCSAVPLPAIDPTGERILLPSPNYTTFVSPYDSVAQFGCLPKPAFTEPPPIPPCQPTPPGRPPGAVGTGV